MAGFGYTTDRFSVTISPISLLRSFYAGGTVTVPASTASVIGLVAGVLVVGTRDTLDVPLAVVVANASRISAVNPIYANDDRTANDAWSASRGLATAPYMGLVGCRGKVPDKTTGNYTGMFRRAEFARDAMTSFQLIYGGYWVDESVATDTATGEVAVVDRLIAVSIEYPEGVYTRVTFGGANSVTIPSGAAAVISDAVTSLSIPKGAAFWVNTFQNAGAGNTIPVHDSISQFTAMGDRTSLGTGTVTDQTMTTWAQGGAEYRGYGPLAIIGMTSLPSIVLAGDSLVVGNNSGINTNPFTGLLAPALGPLFGMTNLARGSERLTNFVAGSMARRSQLFQYASHVALEYGINDLYSGGKTGVQVDTLRQQAKAAYPAVKAWLETTITPKIPTSSDSWATLSGQTVDAQLAERTIANNLIRARASVYFEIADATESARASGKHKASPMTPGAIVADGTHFNDAGYALAKTAVNGAVVRR